MKNRMGLSSRHGVLVENLLQEVDYPLTANAIRDRLWDSWGKNAPTCRELGIYLKLHPSTIRTNKKVGPGEYLWGVDNV